MGRSTARRRSQETLDFQSSSAKSCAHAAIVRHGPGPSMRRRCPAGDAGAVRQPRGFRESTLVHQQPRHLQRGPRGVADACLRSRPRRAHHPHRDRGRPGSRSRRRDRRSPLPRSDSTIATSTARSRRCWPTARRWRPCTPRSRNSSRRSRNAIRRRGWPAPSRRSSTTRPSSWWSAPRSRTSARRSASGSCRPARTSWSDKPGVTTLRATGRGPSRAGADQADLLDPLRRPPREPGDAACRRARARRCDRAGGAHDGHRAAQDRRQSPRLVLETRAVRRRPRRPRHAPGGLLPRVHQGDARRRRRRPRRQPASPRQARLRGLRRRHAAGRDGRRLLPRRLVHARRAWRRSATRASP